MENNDKEKMEQNNLSKLSLHLKSILNSKIYNSDKDIIKQTYNLVNDLLENKNCVNDEMLDLIEKNIDYLYIKYENLDYLVNLYVSVYSYYKKIVRKRYVDGLRKINRETRKKMKKMSDEELKEAIRGMEYDPSRNRYIGDDGSELVVKPDFDGKGYRLDYYDSTTYGNAPHNSIHIVANTDESWKKTVNDRDNGTQEKSSGSGCYLTTACMKHMQDDFDDDCYELFILRWFRDNFVPKQDINHYYEIAPKIVEEIEKNPECDIVYNFIYETVIVPCVKAIRYGDFAFAYSRYKNSILVLEETYVSLDLNQNSNKVLTLNTITA